MTYDQLARAIEQLREWDREISEMDNYDPHGYNADRRREIDRLRSQEIPE